MNLEEAVFFESFPSQPRKGDLRRLEILQAAIKIMAREGYDSAILASVAKQLKTRRPHIIYYFKDRDALLMGALQFVTAVAQRLTVARVTKAQSPIEKIIAISDAAFEWASEYPEQAKFMLLLYYQCTFEKSYMKVHAQVREAGFQRIRALLTTILPSSAGALGLDGLAKTIQVVSMGYLVEHLTTGQIDIRVARERCEVACREWIEFLAKS